MERFMIKMFPLHVQEHPGKKVDLKQPSFRGEAPDGRSLLPSLGLKPPRDYGADSNQTR